MLEKLAGLPTANRILPFVRLFYASTSNYIWTDAEGTARVIQQTEGGEQGDPLMPALFCLGIHDALHNVSANLRADEHVLAYLDDIYIVASRDRTRVIYDEVTTALREIAGIEPNLGKTEA